MRRVQIVVLSLLALLAGPPVRSSVCTENARVGDLKVDHYIADAVLHRRWAVIVDCGHPERPWTSQAVPWRSDVQNTAIGPTQVASVARTLPSVPAGAKVRLWRVAEGANIELSGTALEAGSAGQMIHVRIGQRGTVLEGKVRGAGSVELSAPARQQSRQALSWSAQ